MATMFEDCTTKEQHSVLWFFCGQKDFMQETFTKKFFSVYGGKCLSCKAVHSWIKKFSQEV
jgi:hypothetical protein